MEKRKRRRNNSYDDNNKAKTMRIINRKIKKEFYEK